MPKDWTVVPTYHGLKDPEADKLFGVVLSLGAEVWTLRDRVNLLEEVLESKGIDVKAAIDERARDNDRVPELERDRDAFMERFLRALNLRFRA